MLEELLALESPVRVEKDEKDLPEENFDLTEVSPSSNPRPGGAVKIGGASGKPCWDLV